MADHLRGAGGRRRPERRRDLVPGRGAAPARRRTARAPGSPCWGRTGLGRGAARGGAGAGRRSGDARAVAVRLGLRARGPVEDDHAGGGPDQERAARGWRPTPTRRCPPATGWRPGHGTLVSMISGFAGVSPEVAGKPERPLFDETLRRVGGDRPLMVGDSLHTDIAGAHRRRDRLAAGDDRRDGAAPTWWPRAPSSDRPGSGTTCGRWADPGCAADRGRTAAGGPADGRPRCDAAGLASTGSGEPGRLVGGGRRGGLGPPRRDRRRRPTSTACPLPATDAPRGSLRP